MTTLPSSPRKRLVPQDAACLVIADRRGPKPRLLMGRRRPDQVFLPNVWVFPGGRVEAIDHELAGECGAVPAFAPLLTAALRGGPAGAEASVRSHALALAAIRETFEETGYLLARPSAGPVKHAATWRDFWDIGYRPELDRLQPIVRAITPPGRPRRYDTRFFLADAEGIALKSDLTDDEFTAVDWFTVDDIVHLEIAGITRLLLSDIRAAIDNPPSGAALPFYRQVGRHYARKVLTPASD